MPNHHQQARSDKWPVFIQLLISIVGRVWNIFTTGLIWVQLLGGFFLLRFIGAEPKRPARGIVNDKDVINPRIRPIQSWRAMKILIRSIILHDLCRPKSFKLPFIILTTSILCAFRSLANQHVAFNGTSTFLALCPEENRRTQTGVFVKLLAANVTTICAHGHLASLAGSRSWRRELFRAIEILFVPMAPLFALADTAWFELASIPTFARRPSDDHLTIKYKLARICNMRLDITSQSSSPFQDTPLLASINPRHVKPISLNHDLKSISRKLGLFILASQYVQATILLTRRALSGTAATIELAMFLLVVSGLTALAQSITISIIHTSWVMKPDFELCLESACSWSDCAEHKNTSGVSNDIFRVVVFGFDITGVPRMILYELAAGWLSLDFLLHFNKSVWDDLKSVFALLIAHSVAVDMLVYVDSIRHVLKRLESDTSGSATLEMMEIPSNIVASNSPSDTTSSTSTGSEDPPAYISTTSIILSSLPGFGMFIFGLVAIVLALLSAIWILSIIPTPSIAMYYSIVIDNSTWKTWKEANPCPQLWKDSLED